MGSVILTVPEGDSFPAAGNLGNLLTRPSAAADGTARGRTAARPIAPDLAAMTFASAVAMAAAFALSKRAQVLRMGRRTPCGPSRHAPPRWPGPPGRTVQPAKMKRRLDRKKARRKRIRLIPSSACSIARRIRPRADPFVA